MDHFPGFRCCSELSRFFSYYIDVYSQFILPDGSVRGWNNQEPQNTSGPAAYADYGLHPNAFGYARKADAWAAAIHERLQR